MKKIFAIMFSFFMLTSAFAAKQSTVDVSALTAEQISQINKQVSDMKESPTNVSSAVRQEAEAWGTLGANMGKAMVGAAKEVGVAANEFANTNLGQVVVGIVAYKVIGRDFLGIIFGSIVLIFGYSLAVWVFSTHRWSNVKYEYEPILWGMFQRKKVIEYKIESDVATTKVLAGCAILALTTIVGFNTIF